MRITRKWKNILSIGLAVLVLFGAVGAVASFATNDSKPAGAVFKVGGLDPETGEYIKSKTSIYTEKVVECQGLKVKPEFESDVTYQIFWYNEDEIYFGCTEKTTNPNTVFAGPVPECAKYCRIVIYPSQLDEDDKQIKDFEVSVFDVLKITRNLEITVAKKQEFSLINLFENLETPEVTEAALATYILSGDRILISNKTLAKNPVNTSQNESSDTESIVVFQPEDVAVYKLDLTDSKSNIRGYFFSSEGNKVSGQTYAQGGIYFIEVPENADGLSFCLVVEDVIDYSSLTVYLPRN